MIYYVCEGNPDEKYNAMSKARNDVINIERNMELNPLIISTKFGVRRNKFLKPLQLLSYYQNYIIWKKEIKKIEQGDLLIIQYPLVNTILNFKKIMKISKKKKITTVLIVHDLDSLRGTCVPRIIKEDKEILHYSSYIIAHNEYMKRKLVEMGNAEEKIIILSIFDYLTDIETIDKEREKSGPIIIAGNLIKTKAKYLEKIKNIKNIQFNLYGKGYEAEENEKNINYKGAFLPEELLNNLEGSFGLVWDGESIETCTGSFGEYLKYNNPHKTSLYLAAGIPVIVWEEAAISKFVLKNKVGITVKKLEDIYDKINSMSEEEYEELVKNARKVSTELKDGYYLKRAILQILDEYKTIK